MANIKAAIITIGDELLIGQTIDTNSSWIAQRLNDFGIDVVRRVAVGDNKQDIIAALDEEIPGASIVLITGGLGPTADDITKPLLCEYFGGSLVVNEEVLTYVKTLFERRNLPVLERNLKQAEVPDNCKVLFNKQGTAPGMLFEKDAKVIISMPGVPHEMMGIMEDEVVPELQRRFVSDALVHASILTAGQGESFIAERIKDLEEALPSHIRLAYLPGGWMVKLRLTGRGPDRGRLIKELKLRQEEIANRLEEIVVALEDLDLEHIIGKLLTVKEKTLGLAESCTGGNIAHKMTQIMGSAKYFNGSIVCYQNDIKEKLLGVHCDVLKEQGAVCEDVAAQMARGAMTALNADYGFGITGLLSPGGDDDKVPVGTVWVGVCDKDRVKTKKFHFPYDRLRNKEVAVNMGLLMIWKFINKKL
jgi:nicotinamide-nucleotide amidase